MWDDPRMLDKYLPPGWIKNNNELTVKSPNGSIIYFLGADKPDSLRGPNPYGVIFDEFDDVRYSVWTDVVRPVLAMNKGWAWFLGTPKGTGQLEKLFNLEGDWKGFLLKASQSGLISQDELDSLKKEIPDISYRQEMECEFIAGGARVFKTIEENVYYDKPKIYPNRQYKLGCDIAKLEDWTVIIPIDLHSWEVGEIVRFNQIDYPMIEARIEAEYLRYGKPVLTLDATGIGEPVCDHLEQKGIGLERFIFTEESRKKLLFNLAIKLEQRQIKFPNNEQLIKELKGMRYELMIIKN